MTGKLTAQDVEVRALAEADLVEADRVMRLAFGTFLRLPDPMAFLGDGDYVRSRWSADPGAALAAEANGRVVGSNFATRWGSVGYFGPLTVHPALWDRGIARQLMGPTMEIMDGLGLRHCGLFTFGHSPKRIPPAATPTASCSSAGSPPTSSASRCTVPTSRGTPVRTRT